VSSWIREEGTTTVSGIARDDRALYKVEIRVDGVLNGTRYFKDNVTSANWSFDVRMRHGDNRINVTVTDRADRQTSVEKTYDRKDPEEPHGFLPGFEALLLVMAISVGLALLARKRRRT
jgi:hypothetical protein